MKKKSIIFFLFIFFPSLCIAQVTWYSQNSGTNRELTDVSFVDQNNGWICGWTETMLHTTNGGQDWVSQTVPPNNAYYSVEFVDTQNGWASGYAGQIIHTSDGGQNWEIQTSNVPDDIYSLFFINADTGWAAGGRIPAFPSNIPERVILRTTNGGNTWNVQYFQTNESVLKKIYFVDANNGYSTGDSGELLHTTNGGAEWTQLLVNNGLELRSIFFINTNTGWVVGNGGFPNHGVIYKTADGGNSWNETVLGENEFLTGVHFTNASNGWAVGNDFGSGNIGIIYHTSDGGESWLNQSIPLTEALFSVFFINGNTGWATGHLGTVLATENITPVDLTSFNAYSNKNNVNLIWKTATETNNKGFEVERLKDSKNTKLQDWEIIGFVNGHGTTSEDNNYSFVDKNLQPGSYFYKLIQIDFDGSRNESKKLNIEINSQPSEFSLEQNYPNPFNPATTIQYTIPYNGLVKLSVYNILGEEVKTLINEFQESGRHIVNFKAANFSSGIYMYKLEEGNFIRIRKMILLK